MAQNIMEVDKYRNLKRWLARAIAIALWFASIQFSIDGFNIQAGNAKNTLGWLAFVLGAFVTVMELVWNTPNSRKNVTIFAGGILAYGYGIFTNITGFYTLQGYALSQVYDDPKSIIFASVVGIICEVIPEALLVWSLLDDKQFREGDFIGNLLGVHGDESKFSNPIQQEKERGDIKPSNDYNRQSQQSNPSRNPTLNQKPAKRINDWQKDGREIPSEYARQFSENKRKENYK